MDVYQTEEEQIENIKQWWAENGRSIVLGIVVGLIAVFGWRGWQEQKLQQAAAASVLFESMVTAQRQAQVDTARERANTLTSEFSDTIYSTYARLFQAKLEADAGDIGAAKVQLEAALQKAKGLAIEYEIRLRLARIMLAQQNTDAARAMLSINVPSGYQPSFLMLQGDIAAARGDIAAARAAYRQALALVRTRGADGSDLEMKLDNLGQDQNS